ncbi:TPA: TIGR04540 family protein [Clostridium sporogenes]
MKTKVFCKSQLELSKKINSLMDAYWNDQIEEKILINNIQQLVKYNDEKLFKDNQYTKVIEQRCGKRRLELLNKILKISL